MRALWLYTTELKYLYALWCIGQHAELLIGSHGWWWRWWGFVVCWVSSGAGALIKKCTSLLLLRERERQTEKESWGKKKSNTFISGQQDPNTFRYRGRERWKMRNIVRGEGACWGCIQTEKKADKRINREWIKEKIWHIQMGKPHCQWQ